jgi:uncharacterized protein
MKENFNENIVYPPVFWRRLDMPGYESGRVSGVGKNWTLEGTAVFTDQQRPCRIDYKILCDSNWCTRSGRVRGWVGEKSIDVDIMVDAEQGWWANGLDLPGLAGCIDLDLSFSPSTNLLPIRRLNLQIGQSGQVNAAWLKYPDFTFETLPQVYRRTDLLVYRYESSGGSFTADVTVNSTGFVVDYPPFWGQL